MENYRELIKASYNEGAHGYHQNWPMPHAFIDEERQKFKNLIPQGEAILDLGCGPGMDTEYWVNQGYAVTAVDFSENMLSIAKKRAPRAIFKLLDMRNLDKLETLFMGVWASFSLLHVPMDEAPMILTKIKNRLKPKGSVFFAMSLDAQSSFNPVSVKGLTDSQDKQLEPHLQVYSEEDFRRLLQQAGFKITSWRFFNLSPDQQAKKLCAAVIVTPE